MPNYEVWVYQGEEFPHENVSEAHNNDDVEYDRMDEMLQDLREDPDFTFPPHSKEPPPDVKKFFDLLKAAKEPLHVLGTCSQLLRIKNKATQNVKG
jgi:hypothetical protein